MTGTLAYVFILVALVCIVAGVTAVARTGGRRGPMTTNTAATTRPTPRRRPRWQRPKRRQPRGSCRARRPRVRVVSLMIGTIIIIVVVAVVLAIALGGDRGQPLSPAHGRHDDDATGRPADATSAGTAETCS